MKKPTKKRSKLSKPYSAIPAGRYECRINKGPQRGKKFMADIGISRRTDPIPTPAQTAPTAPAQTSPVPQNEAQGQQASPRNEERAMGMSPTHAAPYGSDSDNMLYARNQDAMMNLHRAAVRHLEALSKFRQADISDFSAITDANDALSSARVRLISARQRVLDLNRTND